MLTRIEPVACHKKIEASTSTNLQLPRVNSRKIFFVRTIALAFIVGLCGMCISTEPTCAQQLVPVVVEGDQAPELPDGVMFEDFGVPCINRFGEIAFLAKLASPDVSNKNDGSVWISGLNGLVMLARDGDQAPGQPEGVVYSGSAGASYFDFSDPVLSDIGDVSFFADLGGAGVTFDSDGSLWRGSRSGLTTLVARENTGVPDFLQVTHFEYSVNSPTGVIAFEAWLDGGISGIWKDAGGLLTPIAQEDEAAPGTSADFGPSFGDPIINSSSQLIFSNGLGNGASVSNNASIWFADGATKTLVARENDQASDVEAGSLFDDFYGLALSSDGKVAIGASLDGSVDFAKNQAIWAGDPGNLSLVIREGDLAPGFSDGRTIRFINGDITPIISSNERIAFVAADTIDTSLNNDGIWGGTFDSISLIAYRGDQLPGPTGGQTVEIRSPSAPAINKHGQIVFMARENPGTDDGIWIYGPNGDMKLIAFEGQQFEGDNITALSLLGGTSEEQGTRTSLNEHGQVAMKITLTGGKEGIYVYTPVAQFTGGLAVDGWDVPTSWELGVVPGTPHDVIIDPDFATPTLVLGPTDNTTIRSLQLGGGAGVVELNLQSTSVLTVSNGMVIESNGILTGDCEIVGNVVNDGSLGPGNSFGQTTISGNYTASSGDIEIEIGGPRIGEQYDSVDVGEAFLSNGSINVELVNGFQPSPQSSFLLVAANSIGGDFDFQLPELPSGLVWEPQETPQQISLDCEALGDANDDGVFDNLDISGFVTALVDQTMYQTLYPNVTPDIRLDMNDDGVFTNADIAAFVAALIGG